MIDRELFADKVLKFINNEQIKIITGVRRCGKSFLLKILTQKLQSMEIEQNHIIELSMEDYDFNALCDPDACYNYIKEKIVDEKKYYILIDEVQNIRDWEKVVNSLRLKNTDIYITGSNSKILSGELATLLSGRYVEFKLQTNSFSEVYNYFSAQNPQTEKLSCLQNYILFGGYPLVVTTKYEEELSRAIVTDIFNSTVYKDVITHNKIKDETLLLKIIDFVLDNVGNLFSLKKISDFMNSAGYKTNVQTVSNYISALEKAYIIEKAPRFDIKGKELLATTQKYYIADHSLMYVRKGYSIEYIAQVLENIVFNEIRRRGYKAYVGKFGEKEIDFIAQNADEKIYIQVSYSVLTPETLERELAPLQAVKDSYPKYVVTMDSLAGGNKEGIKFIHLADFLLKKEW